MELSGRCYCGDIRYEIQGELQASLQCHCRECQYITGGNANTVMVFSRDDFEFTKGKPSVFSRGDLQTPVKRFFCDKCQSFRSKKYRAKISSECDCFFQGAQANRVDLVNLDLFFIFYWNFLTNFRST